MNREFLQRALDALIAVLTRDERNTCQHESTHRGGAIWEFCDDCGANWADDMGGKPKWNDPSEWGAAKAVIAELRAALAAPVAPAEPASEPVAYATRNEDGDRTHLWFPKDLAEARTYCEDDEEPEPLYTHAIPPDVQRDAERYRWLASEHGWWLLKHFPAVRPYVNACEVIDESIDAAMTAPKVTP